MLKTLILISLAVVGCHSQLDIPKTATIGRFRSSLISAQVPAVGVAPVGVGVAAPAYTIARPAVAVAAPVAQLPIPIQKIRTQEVLPLQDLGVVNPGPQVVQVRSDQEPVLVHFQSQSAPVQVETSHIPSPPGETTVTQTRDEPHTVIHEIIRPVIQEVREIIQPYRRVTQEIRPVQEEVHTDVAAGAAATAAVSAPAVLKTTGPAHLDLAIPTQSVLAAPAQAAHLDLAIPTQTVVSAPAPQRNLFESIIAAPAPLLTGSYIQQFIDQLGLRKLQTPLVASRPQLTIAAPAVATTAVETTGPIVSEAVVDTPKLVGGRIGSVSFSRKYVEYPN